MKKPGLKASRRTLQILTLIAFIIIPLLNRSRYSLVYGNFLSFHFFGIPLADPLAVLQLSIKNLYLTLDNVIGVAIPLAIAFWAGTVFCSWVCPYGFFSELVNNLSRRVLLWPRIELIPRGRSFYVKLIIFIGGFAGFFVFSLTPVLNQLSLPAWYARFFQYLFGQDYFSYSIFFLAGLLFLEFVAGRRFWCQFICPQSVLLVLVKQFNPKRLRVDFSRDKCICKAGHERCEKACSLQLQPREAGKARELECCNCGACVVACDRMGKALKFHRGKGGE